MQPTSVRLANGEVVAVNDHVYVSLPWSDRDGTPYNIARIIEFLPSSHSKKGTRATGSSDSLVRLSLYYRPADISTRNVADYRLLLAAIHTDVQPVSSVRGKCYVKHKDRVGDLLEWKRLPDHFYFAKFFDPYIKREFEVIPTETVNNIPHDVKIVLRSRYEYIVTERELVADLTDDYRSCCRCQGWASYQESVKCDTCKEHYHMKCLHPPLHAKPAKGYSWVCPPCSFQRGIDVENQKFRFGLQSSSGTAKAKPAKAKHRKVNLDNRPPVTFRGWQWRYFGPHIPEGGHQGRPKISSHRAASVDSFMDEIRKLDLAVPPWDVKRLNLAISSFTTLGFQPALEFMRTRKPQDFNLITFTLEEHSLFENELERIGGLDTHSCGQVLRRSPSEILRYFYIWKNNQLRVENEAVRQHHPLVTPYSRQPKTLGPPSLGKIRSAGDDRKENDSASVYGKATEGEHHFTCATCSTRLGEIWWKCPRTVPGEAMCNVCGSNYRKYGVITYSRSEDSKRIERKDNSLKRVKVGDGGGVGGRGAKASISIDGVAQNRDIDVAQRGIVSTSRPPQQLCSCCRRGDPKRPLYHCKNCGIVVHSGMSSFSMN
ncbi:hypothetical protein L202_06527 [Cryptococcus amylolentus CBS 6039]|uniref:PHD-type domain-containing protein n=1 Tax=Cryptococcus amylolentus CBS 6039 TaxID=1295533 RepID=A0A1E3HIW5_9TREE|nr:hypothetical protein L202_06527 [Cryptococcus amylolentus CBS 6039]ODN75351.1 hypothetical protein L202_06527 [Cryptococcus amylolentus CBS 6039]